MLFSRLRAPPRPLAPLIGVDRPRRLVEHGVMRGGWALVLVAVLAGCGDDSTDGGPDAGATTDAGRRDAAGAVDAGWDSGVGRPCDITPGCSAHNQVCRENSECCSNSCIMNLCDVPGGTVRCTDFGNLCDGMGGGTNGPCCSGHCESGFCAAHPDGGRDICGPGTDICRNAWFEHTSDCDICVSLLCEVDPVCCTGWDATCACEVKAYCPGRCPAM